FKNPVYFIDPDGMMPAGFGGRLGSTDISIDFSFGNESGGNNSGGGALGGADSSTDNSGVKVNTSPKTAIQSNGSSGGDDAINENNPITLDEVLMTTTLTHNQLEVSDAGWFLSTTTEGIKRNSEYNAKYYIAKYGTRGF